MMITLTIPITVGEDKAVLMEFEAAVDVQVTYGGHPSYFSRRSGYGDPGSGPEFEVAAYYVDCGEYSIEDKKRHTDFRKCPENLQSYMDEYIDGDGRMDIVEGIRGDFLDGGSDIP